jgi:hypothetical protein
MAGESNSGLALEPILKGGISRQININEYVPGMLLPQCEQYASNRTWTQSSETWTNRYTVPCARFLIAFHNERDAHH